MISRLQTDLLRRTETVFFSEQSCPCFQAMLNHFFADYERPLVKHLRTAIEWSCVCGCGCADVFFEKVGKSSPRGAAIGKFVRNRAFESVEEGLLDSSRMA